MIRSNVKSLETILDAKAIAITLSLSLLWVALLTGCNTPNNPPVIENLLASSVAIEQGESAEIRCIATDDDEDELNYRWLTTGGTIQGEGANITWVAPDRCADYTISVRITDDRGGEDTDNITIKVAEPG